MQFRDVIGQEVVKDRLRRLVRSGRVPHSLMLTGKEGYGGFPMALALAQYMGCQDRSEEDSCGVCLSCKRMSRFTHPDLHVVVPLSIDNEDRKMREERDENVARFTRDKLQEKIAEDGAYFTEMEWYAFLKGKTKGQIGARAVDEIQDTMQVRTAEMERKVMIIWLPERLHDKIRHKLLKLLEEPPADGMFLLVSAHPERVLPTILSRVQGIHLEPIGQEEICRGLAEQDFVRRDVAENAARAAQGNYARALQLAREGVNVEWCSLVSQLLKSAMTNQVGPMLQCLRPLSRWSRNELVEFVQYLSLQLREIFSLNLGESDMCYAFAEERELAEAMAPYVNVSNVGYLLHECDRAMEHLLANGYQPLIMTDFAFQLMAHLRNSAELYPRDPA